ncbi:nucleoside triphosphate pyrophosphatase [Pseudomaricurvus sp. HS19]|uniref:Maf family protein n=1 Tax=Pseudomaricurvus sp. HS19 TaxID=2692626 RepID=UPI00351AAB04
MQIILASSSKYKRQLIEKLGISIVCTSPDIDESPRDGETPVALAERLSIAKARALAATHPDHLIIGSDQVAHVEGQLLGKPGNHRQATAQLLACRGKTVEFLTGLCLLNSLTGDYQYHCSPIQVRFRPLTEGQIENYLQREQPYDCAGSFRSEGLGIALFESIHGDDPNALIGLPLIELTRMLFSQGIDVLAV